MDNIDPGMISVVMPCYNVTRHVVESINSVLQQNYPHIELIIMDDSSNEDSNTFIERLAVGNSGRITVLHQTNSGPYTAYNRGLAHALGNFVAFLDADGTWHPDSLNCI